MEREGVYGCLPNWEDDVLLWAVDNGCQLPWDPRLMLHVDLLRAQAVVRRWLQWLWAWLQRLCAWLQRLCAVTFTRVPPVTCVYRA